MSHLNLDLLNQFWKRTEKEERFRRYNAAVKAARPFSLDADAVEMVAEMASGANRHKMIPIYREMARLPMPIMWIEFDYMVLHKWRVEHGTTFPIGMDMDEMMREIDSARNTFGKPQRLGFLLDTNQHDENGESFRVTTFGLMNPGKGAPIMASVFPVVSNVTTGPRKVIFNGNFRDRRTNEMIERINLESILPGMMWGMDKNTIDVEWHKSPLFRTNGIEPEPEWQEHMMQTVLDPDHAIEKMAATLATAVLEQKGDLRFVVAALALLNHVPVIFKPYRPKGHLLIHSKMRPFISSSIVTIDLPNNRRRVREIDGHIKSAKAHSRYRRHQVRGHWRVSDHSHGDRWQRFIDPQTMRPRWRIWIANHERGDAELGWVNQFYSVEGKHNAAA